MISWLRRLFETEPVQRSIAILRDGQDEGGSRNLSAQLTGEKLVFSGRDFGAGVEGIFGSREYEWYWTLEADSIAALRKALELRSDSCLLTALEERFGGDAAADLQPFLDSNEIAYEFWSRIGD